MNNKYIFRANALALLMSVLVLVLIACQSGSIYDNVKLIDIQTNDTADYKEAIVINSDNNRVFKYVKFPPNSRDL